MMRAYENFIGEPLRRRRFDLALYRVSQLLHDRTNGIFDVLYMNLAKFLRPKVSLPPSPQMSAEEIEKVVVQLQRDGYMILPKPLDAQEVAEISDFAFSTPGLGSELSREIIISRDAIPEGEARYYWWMDQLAALPAVQRILTEGPYCKIAQEYLGCRPIIAHISLFLDRPFKGNYEPYSYHYDNEGPGFLKFFFFLTDVEVGTGAHYFMVGTHPHIKPKSFAKAAIYKEEDIHRCYGRDKEIIVRGPAGTVLAEDTSGFHRGSILERNHRLLMQIEFSAIDVPTEQELYRDLKPAAVRNLHPGVASIARKFFVLS